MLIIYFDIQLWNPYHKYHWVSNRFSWNHVNSTITTSDWQLKLAHGLLSYYCTYRGDVAKKHDGPVWQIKQKKSKN